MEKIYPEAPMIEESFSLTSEETLLLKRGLVLAIQKEIEHPQDRALDAVTFANLSPEREQTVKDHLQQVMDLEAPVYAEAREIKARLRDAYDKGTTEVVSLVPLVNSNIVDAVICAKRFVEAETGKSLTPVIEKEALPPVEEPVLGEPLGGEEILQP